MAQSSPDQLPADFMGLLHTMPRREDFGTASASYLAWLARASAEVQTLGSAQSILFAKLVHKAHSQDPYQYWEAYNNIATFIRAAALATTPERRMSPRLSDAASGMHPKAQTRKSVRLTIPPNISRSLGSVQRAPVTTHVNTASAPKPVRAAAVRIAAAVMLVATAWLLVFAGREHVRDTQPAGSLQAGIAAGTASGEMPRQDAALRPTETGSLLRSVNQIPEAGRERSERIDSSARQQVAFARPAITVSARAAAAVLTVRRTNGRSGRVQLMWRIKEGTARSGYEFSGPLQGTIEFAHLQTVRSLFIPLKGVPVPGGARKFTVELTAASNGVRIAPNHAVAVTIINYE